MSILPATKETGKAETFTPIPDWIAQRPGLTWTERFVWARINRYENLGEAFPSHVTLAREASICRKQAMRCCHKLQRLGLLSIGRRRKKGSKKFNTCVYRTLKPKDIYVLRVDEAEGHAGHQLKDIDVPKPRDTDVLTPRDIDVPVRDKGLRDKKTREHTNKQQADAVGCAFSFPKTLSVLKTRFPLAKETGVYFDDCRESGLSDEVIAHTLNCYGMGVQCMVPSATTPRLPVQDAIATIKQRQAVSA
jgi:hypothetical protein